MPYFELKKAEEKRPFLSALSYREKKGKETAPSFLGKLSAPRARDAHMRERDAYTRKRELYRLARGTAEEIIDTCFGSRENDLKLWASIFYEYPEDVETILEKAHELSSRWRQHELRNPVSAFQKWLGKNFPKKVAASFGS